MKFTGVDLVEGKRPSVILHDRKEDGTQLNEWKIPLEAIANRTELYGLDSVEQALEVIAKEIDSTDIQEIIPELGEAYSDVVNSEFAQSLMHPPRMEQDEGRKQTVMQTMAIGPSKRDRLNDVRSRALEALGVDPATSSEPQLRTMGTMSAASPAARGFDTSEDVILKISGFADQHREELEAFRVQTAIDRCPQLKNAVDKQLEQKRREQIHEL